MKKEIRVRALLALGGVILLAALALVIGFLKHDAAARAEFAEIADFHNRIKLAKQRGDKEFAAVEENCFATSAVDLVSRQEECKQQLTTLATVVDEIEGLSQEAHTYDLSNSYLNPELASAIQNWRTLSSSSEYQKFIQSLRNYLSIYQEYIAELDEDLLTKDINTMTPAEITHLREYLATFKENIQRVQQAQEAALRDGKAMQAYAEANNLTK